jgi:hypothetical protein
VILRITAMIARPISPHKDQDSGERRSDNSVLEDHADYSGHGHDVDDGQF